MKRSQRTILRLVLLIFSVLLLTLPTIAQDHGAPTIVKVGYFDYGGFLEKDQQGRFYGYGYEYLQEIANYTGWTYQFVPGSFRECMDRLSKGEIDLISNCQFTGERAQTLDYARFESGVEYTVLSVPGENTEVYYEDPASFEGLRVAILSGSYQDGLFQRYAEQNGFTYQSVYFDSEKEISEALSAGKVDAVVSGSLRQAGGEKVVARFSPEPFYFVTTKGNQAVLEGVNLAMEEIRTSDLNYNAKLHDKYYGNSIFSQLAFTRREAAYIQEHPVLRVAYNASWKPVEYRDERTGEFCGVNAQLMEMISQKSGIRFEYVPAGSFQQAQELLMAGGADLVCGYAREQFQSAKRQGIYLSKPYWEMPMALAARPGTPYDALRTIAAPAESQGLVGNHVDQLTGTEVVFLPDLDACLEAVRRGGADAAVSNVYNLSQQLKRHVNRELEMPVNIRVNYSICVGISEQQDRAALSVLNKVISGLDSDEVQQVVLENTIQPPEARLPDFLQRYGIGVVLLVLLVIMLMLAESKRQAERLAYVDQLTGCKNLTRFELDAEKLLRGAKGAIYGVVDFDVDKFKVVNDMYGYDMGDEMLRSIAAALKNELKPDELYCRGSNDHFILLLSAAGKDELRARVQEMLDRLCTAPRLAKKNFQISFSCGIYLVGEEYAQFSAAVDRANLARLSVKDDHKNAIAFYDSAMRDHILREKEIENKMEGALAGLQFQVYYQPKCSLENGRVVGAEALVRWQEPDGKMLYPDEFIPVFESNGFIIDLDLYVFRQVCACLRGWLDRGLYPYPISVNLSRVHLYQPGFHLEYLDIMKEFHIPAYLIELELTENVMFDNQTRLISIMKELKSSGLSISMDDFGSGYSSLNLLKDMPIDFLKLDRGFFNVASDSERGKKIIRCVVNMARQLEISVVSEGVETGEQVEFLREIHCDIAQGYYYYKPVPVETYEKIAFAEQSAQLAR